MLLIINDEQDKHLISKTLLKTVEKVMQSLAKSEEIASEKEVGLILVDDEIIKELNAKFRGKDAPTDVLSFPLAESEEQESCPCVDETFGDIYISIERAILQAEDYGHSVEREVCFLALHGLLHLKGYDHETPQEEEEMNQKIEKVLAEYSLAR